MKPELYGVVTQEMWDLIPILDDGCGPREYFRDYTEVWARDPLEAKVKAVRSKAFKNWREWCRNGDESPYVGLKARKI